MPSKRKFHKTVLTVTVLSEEPISPDIDLADVAHEIIEGDWSGDWGITEAQEVDAKTIAKLLREQGSDPEFFGINDEGDDVNG